MIQALWSKRKTLKELPTENQFRFRGFLAMEIESEDGSEILLEKGKKTKLGRGIGFHSDDRTISRRQMSVQLHTGVQSDNNHTAPRVSFEVIGKNPICKLSSESGEIRVFRRSEKGELAVGDRFCPCASRPLWFTVKRAEPEDMEVDSRGLKDEPRLAEVLESGTGIGAAEEDLAFESLDVSNIDPVREFGFIAIGHEFDQYPKQMIRAIKNWNWFLEDPREDSGDEDAGEKKANRSSRRKRKKAGGIDDDDDEWTGEDDDNKEQLLKFKKVQKSKYPLTRSHDRGKSPDGPKNRIHSLQKKNISAEQEDDDDDEETLGGFIVNDDDDELEEEGEESDDDEEEEEEFEADDGDDEEED